MNDFQKVPDEYFKQNTNLKRWSENNAGLWCLGDLNLLNMNMISVVGSRDVTPHGIKRTQQLIRILVQNDFCVVSGLAAGVDRTAHEETLKLNGKTIAVMGTPINEVFPKGHVSLKNEIQKNGLVLSQFAPGTPVQKFNFPKRNDLMAAMSLITIVVEAGEGSGTRHQIASAFKYGRFAAFTKNLATSNVKWVETALKEDKSYVISDEEEFVKFLKNLDKNQTDKKNIQLDLFEG